MCTRSQSRNNFPQQEASPVIIEPLRIELPFLENQSQEDPPPEDLMADNRTMMELLQAPTEGYEDAIVILEIAANNFELKHDPPEVPMADNRTMAELLQAPTEGYEDTIVIPEIAANNFELKHGLINLVQNKQFFGHDKGDPHAHIRYFNKITSTMRVPNFFPPIKTTNLRNEITRFQQRFDESFYEAWDCFIDLLSACLHHGFSELHQLDTFYNALNVNDQDSLNSAAGGNFLDKMPRECLKIIESKYKVRQSRAKAVVAKVSTSSSTSAISSEVYELKDMNVYRDNIQEYVSQDFTRFQQRFDESFYEAWDCFNDLLRACLHHGFSELHQLDTFYNALNVNDQDSLNSTAGVVAKVSTSSSTPAISFEVSELKDMVRALLLDKKNQSSAPA
nr:hypothetical protein [Tanacetum cinerariifolium]